jgi:hypothetical protein
MVLDRVNRVAYAAIGERTDIHVLETFCDRFDYQYIAFRATQKVDGEEKTIYHTNVMLRIGEKIAAICLDSIQSSSERQAVKEELKKSGRKILELTPAQMESFAGNMLNVHNTRGESFCILSQTAKKSLRPDQIEFIEKYARILAIPLPTIERLGGGSARCMIAEIFLPKEKKHEQ